MQTVLVLSLCLVLIIAIGPGCASPFRSSQDRAFEFSSGGADHPQGFGEWRVSVDAGGTASIAHDVRGEVEEFGPFELAKRDNSRLWELIDAAGILDLESSERQGVPDEVRYTFVLTDATGTHEAQIWVNDARESAEITALVDGIAVLIEAHTHQKPVLR